MNGNEYDVAVLQADVVRCVTVQQIVVDIESLDCLASALDLHVTQRTVVGWTTCSVKRSKSSRRTRDAIAPGRQNFAEDEDLIGAQSDGTDRKSRSRTGPATHAGVHTTQSCVENVLELSERKVRYIDLARLRYDDEPF